MRQGGVSKGLFDDLYCVSMHGKCVHDRRECVCLDDLYLRNAKMCSSARKMCRGCVQKALDDLYLRKYKNEQNVFGCPGNALTTGWGVSLQPLPKKILKWPKRVPMPGKYGVKKALDDLYLRMVKTCSDAWKIRRGGCVKRLLTILT